MSAIPRPPPDHWWHCDTPGAVRPSEAILRPQACLENDVRKALQSFGADDRVELIMLAADEYAAAAVHLFARPSWPSRRAAG